MGEANCRDEKTPPDKVDKKETINVRLVLIPGNGTTRTSYEILLDQNSKYKEQL